MKSCIKFALLLALSFVCDMVFASAVGGDGISLQPSSNDQSMFYLGTVFGQVGHTINAHQHNAQLLGKMFHVFNSAVLVLGTIIFTYVYGKGILDTAAHGEFLGKQQNSLWIPLRSVLGITFMIPKASSGYCVIQVFLMWVVVNGIGAADMIWTTLVHSWSSTAAATKEAGNIVTASSASMLYTPAQTLFSSLVCAYSLQHGNGGSFTKDYTQPRSNTYQIAVTYHGSEGGNTVDCGNVNWSSETAKNTCKEGDTACVNKAMENQKNDLLGMINELQPIAMQYVDDSYRYCQKFDPQKPAECISPAFPDSLTGGTASQKAVANDIFNSDAVNKGNFITAAVNNYIDSYQSQTENNDLPNPAESTGHDAIDDGWIYAGSYFYKLGNATAASGSIPSFMAKTASDLHDYLPYGNTSVKNSKSFVQDLPAPSQQSQSTLKRKSLDTLFQVYGGLASAGFYASGIAAGVTQQFGLGAVLLMMGGVTTTFTVVMHRIISLNHSPTDTLLYLQTLGHVVLIMVGITFFALLVGVFATGIATNVMNCMQPLGYAIAETSSYVSLMTMSALAALIVAGGLLAVYLPLLPFIYFLFGVLSWFVAVLETMVAAPIVALGIIHPEGHDFWGKAEPAVMLTINIFLRPSLMLFGMVAGLLLSYVYVQVLTIGFAQAQFSFKGASGWVANPIEAFLIMGIYIFLIVIGYTQCFKLINEVPNRVLQWLGFQGQLGLPSDDAMNQARQGHSTVAGAVQGGFSKTGDMLRDKARQQKQDGNNTPASVSSQKTHQAPNSSQNLGPDPTTQQNLPRRPGDD